MLHDMHFFFGWWFQIPQGLQKTIRDLKVYHPKKSSLTSHGPRLRSYILPPDGYGVDLGAKLGNIELQFLGKWSRNKTSHLQKVVSLQSVRFCWLKDVTYIIHFWHGWSCRSALVALHHSGEGGATWAFWWGNGRLKPSPVLTTWNPPNTSSRIYIYIIICLSQFEFWFCFIFSFLCTYSVWYGMAMTTYSSNNEYAILRWEMKYVNADSM